MPSRVENTDEALRQTRYQEMAEQRIRERQRAQDEQAYEEQRRMREAAEAARRKLISETV